MALERTLAIIKPDAMQAQRAGAILGRIEQEGFRVLGLRRLELSLQQAQGFYHVHRERPFFASLTAFMSSGPVIVMALEAEDAIARWRAVIGPTDPAKASDGTIRKLHGTSVERNAVHGSDAPETSAREIGYFFSGIELGLTA